MDESYHLGDSGQPFTYTREDANGDPVALTGRSVTIRFERPDGTYFDRSATVDTASATYLLDVGDFDQVGLWFYEWHEADLPDYANTTRAQSFYVNPRLGS